MTSYFASYIGTSAEERGAMLKELEVDDINELFSDIPPSLLQSTAFAIPGPYSEAALTQLFTSIAKKNYDPIAMVSFVGGGLRETYIPAALEELMRRGELYTAYTPYQPEISQGMLQLLYEYQSMVAELLEMDVVNASMYDWASALGECLLVMARLNKRRTTMLLAEPINPKHIEVACSYLAYSNVTIEVIPAKDGNVDTQAILKLLQEEKHKDKSERTYAGLYFEAPTFFGTLPTSPHAICVAAHELDILVTVGVGLLSLGTLTPPSVYGADFAVGEGQVLGNPLASGGPLLGILAIRYDPKWLRQIPGRLIGITKELASNETGYCITLSTREQHIRREKATSNICSNQAITAVNAAIYLAALGKQGITELSQGLVDKAHYLASQLATIPDVELPFPDQPFFDEFVIRFNTLDHATLESQCLAKGYLPGLRVESQGCMRLLSVSELHTKHDLDTFVEVIKEASS